MRSTLTPFEKCDESSLRGNEKSGISGVAYYFGDATDGISITYAETYCESDPENSDNMTTCQMSHATARTSVTCAEACCWSESARF